MLSLLAIIGSSFVVGCIIAVKIKRVEAKKLQKRIDQLEGKKVFDL